jgi:hypothetical protein
MEESDDSIDKLKNLDYESSEDEKEEKKNGELQ